VVRFKILHLGEHTIDNMIITGPSKDIIEEMMELFLASYTGPPDGDLDYMFARYIIDFSQGQGEILEWERQAPGIIH